ncbi:MAG: cell division protein FtsA [Candidatus Komeilibacteria bacterium CG11_big_fil_rev_8_21_14_0_20_36_20]|uniref:Cell division protein FtsA n=1 Tax=Candidatus Komeilibacteria bacterium CG11_big_fil_rev_8_21_14_0_20_36_20 TaxID=1974477 RepID=A0A2H0NDU1_9BACT|nr:MAG: cell division protein FtsA [Candidatus Komeilibacteria bacterium CG11_big_fil_rev_8_21_14_0_20_36_20]PIR81428.1 MAG: cell division protein FtsA [Candidatus Komeilibacteria bacterium CG10_big_fil_rev_8_21_14_0_10_36_65]PJC55154.1 MAG: cell division protein FtsA [Candidatus Komeilibacteria bacterium CG_4_9_14_0_2_um_filter_36_13]
MASSKDMITGLDIGSSAVRIVMAQRLPDGRLKVIGAAETPAEGISRGSITSIEDAVSSISETIEKCERMTGLHIDRMVVGMSGTHIKTVNSKGVVAVARANEQVDESDLERAREVAERMIMLPNYELLDILPITYNLDDQKNIKDPLGMSGVRLEVETQVVMALSSQLKSLTKCIYRTGVDIEDIVFSILATAEAVLTQKQKDLGVAVVNIGAATTSIAVFEEGSILYTAVLPIGSGHITNDLAIGLKTSIETAEAVKLDQAQALGEDISKRDEIDLNKYSEEEKKGSYVYKKDIADIAGARMDEIFQLVNDELKKIERDGKLPAGVILTGGGAKLPLAVDLAKEIFQLPVFLGLPVESNFPIDKLNDLEYTTALGLVIWADKNLDAGNGWMSNFSVVNRLGDKTKKWFRSLWPST